MLYLKWASIQIQTIVDILFLMLAAMVALFILLYYVPLYKSTFGNSYSPRLAVVKILAYIDVFITLYLLGGAIFSPGDSSFVMVEFAVANAVGMSLAILLVRKYFRTKWEIKYNSLLLTHLQAA